MKLEKYLGERTQKQRELFMLGRKVQDELIKNHVMTLKPRAEDFAKVAKALYMTKSKAITAWNEFTWGD